MLLLVLSRRTVLQLLVQAACASVAVLQQRRQEDTLEVLVNISDNAGMPLPSFPATISRPPWNGTGAARGRSGGKACVSDALMQEQCHRAFRHPDNNYLGTGAWDMVVYAGSMGQVIWLKPHFV